jgi:Polyketide cyclase / dehydrase and lipid transport
MRVLKVLGILVLLIVCAVGVMLVMGSMLPHAHTASATVELAAPQTRVWQLIEDIHTQPTWRTGLLSVELTAPQNGHPCWTEIQKHMHMPLCEDLATPPSTRIVRIADPSLPFGGDWVYQLQPINANSSRLTITENGTTGQAFYRFVGHYIMHEDMSIKQFEADLQKAVTK